MKQIEEDFKATCNLISQAWRNTPKFSKYGDIFLFGTENQEGISSALDFKGKSAFTVASAGEPYLNAIYNEATKVDIFDINRLQCPITYLKIASMMALSYEEFFAFLTPVQNGIVPKSFLCMEIFSKVMPYLPDDYAWYWMRVLLLCANKQYGNYFCPTATMWNDIAKIKQGIPFYMNKEEYYKLQDMLRGREFPKFYELDILHKPVTLKQKYDILYLSNIMEHEVAQLCYEMNLAGFPFSEIEFEIDVLMNLLPNVYALLKKDGTALMGYRNNRKEMEQSDLFYNNTFFEVTSFAAKLEKQEEWQGDTDLALTYTPSKNGRIDDY